MENKICKRCIRELPLTSFYKNKNGIKGVNTYCIDCSKSAAKKSHSDNKESILERQKVYRSENKHYFLKKNKEWRVKTGYATKYARKRLKEDGIFKIKSNIRSLIKNSFKNRLSGIFSKPKKTELLLGCSMSQFLDHLSSKFQEGMSFENHGKWHIDHKIPLSIAKTEDELIKLCHYTNLQPLWAIDNLKKYNKVNNETFEKP